MTKCGQDLKKRDTLQSKGETSELCLKEREAPGHPAVGQTSWLFPERHPCEGGSRQSRGQAWLSDTRRGTTALGPPEPPYGLSPFSSLI